MKRTDPLPLLRSLWFYRRTHLGTALGAAVGVAVLIGALVVGDSLRHSLARVAAERLGRTVCALDAGARTVRAALADDLSATLGADVAPVLRTGAVAATEGGQRRVSRVQLLGVDRRFWAVGGAPDPLAGGRSGEGAVNAPLARALGLKVGDELLLRCPRGGWLSGDLPFAQTQRAVNAFRLKITNIVPDERFGRFDLRINQVAPLSVFLPLAELGELLESPGRANVLLAATPRGRALSAEAAQQALGRVWTIADAGLTRRGVKAGGWELVSDQVFLEAPVETAAVKAGGKPVLTYFVNELAVGDRRTPYSFVAAPGLPVVPEGAPDDGIVVNTWLAQDLGAKRGDQVRLKYFALGPTRTLEERSAEFRVTAVIPLAGAAADPGLMPTIPGLSDTGDCRDWDPGIPIDLERIHPKDEAYWDAHRGTPKAFVTLAAARRLWANPFGAATAVRFPDDPAQSEGAIRQVLAGLKPEAVGLAFRPVRQEGGAAAAEGADFSGLFVGFSFTLLVSAFLLTALLFALGAEERSAEAGLLRAVGFSPGRLRRFRLAEAAGVALAGGVAGVPLGLAYSAGVLGLLGTVWRGATGEVSLRVHLGLTPVLVGVVGGALAAVAAVGLVLERQIRRPVRALLAGAPAENRRGEPKGRATGFLVGALVAAAGVATIVATVPPGRGPAAAGAFWLAGSLTLVGGLGLVRWGLDRLVRRGGARPPSLRGLGWRNAARRPGRSVAVVCLLAVGIWVVVAVGANRKGAVADPDRRGSGTGGFAFYGETTLPVPFAAANPAARQRFGLSAADGAVRIVPLRVREGDDASCLNLNRVRQPRLLGVDPGELAGRGAFAAAQLMPGLAGPFSWRLLDASLPDGTVPAAADERVIVWGLGKKVGDVVEVTDERGGTVRLRLVAALQDSVFQGSLVLSIRAFAAAFPSVSGARVLLVDAPPNRREAVRETLNRALQDFGLELTPAGERLAAFQGVENTYLAVFLALGGLGLLLGTVGLGAVLLRNALERRGELALLRAVGFPTADLRRLLLVENGLLLAAGTVLGAVAAGVSTLPALLSPGAALPIVGVLVLLTLIVLNGLLWSSFAARRALKGPILAALRQE